MIPKNILGTPQSVLKYNGLLGMNISALWSVLRILLGIKSTFSWRVSVPVLVSFFVVLSFILVLWCNSISDQASKSSRAWNVHFCFFSGTRIFSTFFFWQKTENLDWWVMAIFGLFGTPKMVLKLLEWSQVNRKSRNVIHVSFHTNLTFCLVEGCMRVGALGCCMELC